jgi:hypothetical protein
MIRGLKALLGILGTVVLFLFGIAIAVEWAIWALWFAPAVLGLYIFFSDRFTGLATKYLGALLLVISWEWATFLSRVLLPSLSRTIRYLLNMPFNPDDYGVVDGVPYLILGLLSAAGCGVFAHVVATHAAWRLPSREQRIQRYRLVGSGIALIGASGLFFLGHPYFAGFAAVAVAIAVAVNTSVTEDPAATMAVYKKVQLPVVANAEGALPAESAS